MRLIPRLPVCSGTLAFSSTILCLLLSPTAYGANTAPTISGTPPTSVTVGSTYAFTPKASDKEGSKLTFSISNKPGWATFSTSTGKLSGTPKSANAGTFGNITIRVSDGSLSRSLAAFSITVKSASTANTAPKISGTPLESAVWNQAYSFQPVATDANGDALTFSITNPPAWATFDTVTGRLSGTPSPTSTGNYPNIVIRVSDGKASASLAAFSISVTSGYLRQVTLSWSAPRNNTDGSTLTNLAGYRVYYGQQSGNYSQTLSLPSASLTSVMIENLASGTWYFAVKALAGNGTESVHSSPVSKTLP